MKYAVFSGATLVLCHSSLQVTVFLVSPMYLSPQSLYGTSYTTSFWFSAGIFSFTCTSKLLMVLCGLNTALTPSGAHTFSNFSLVPRMYGVHRMVGLSSGWLSSSGFLRGCESVFFTNCSGKHLLWRPLLSVASPLVCQCHHRLGELGFSFLASHLWGLSGGGESGRKCTDQYVLVCDTLWWTDGCHPWTQEHPGRLSCPPLFPSWSGCLETADWGVDGTWPGLHHAARWQKCVLPDDKSVIHIASPNGLLDGLLFKLFHEQICNDGGQRGTHCCTIGLLVELALALEIGGVEA